MRVLLTGGSGFVGGALARHLVERGHSVRALVRRTSKAEALRALGIGLVYGDLGTGDGLDEAVAGVDVVQHVAGVIKGRTEADYQRGNAEATRLVCQALVRAGGHARLVFCSSLAAAGPARVGRPRTEEDPDAPISSYGRSKHEAEDAVRAHADRIPSVIVRPPFVYGPGDLVNLPPLLAMGRLGVYLKAGFGPKHFSFVHVDDLCAALLTAQEKGQTLSSEDPTRGVYFVADPNPYSWEAFCTALSGAMGKPKPRVVPLPEAMGFAVGLGSEIGSRLLGTVSIMSRDKAREMACEAWTCSPARASEDLGFHAAYLLEGGLAHTVAWYRQRGML